MVTTNDNTGSEVTTYTLPQQAEALIKLAEKIIEQHSNAGPQSPVKPHLIADLNSRISPARARHEQGLRYARMAEDAFAERDELLGKIPGRKSELDVRNLVEIVVQLVKEHYPESVHKWGFE
ncbi:hypothetical protein [Dawidia soli]|uniref:Uncharacterized protein n=1 Tax=Dawidia soli TaxID=2782352 RepID=A0AAP2GG65_9BACT|nr:hypothetical protein [Dawidia soli]MBT1685205.1 hypothetical protein [Dawidia soli]